MSFGFSAGDFVALVKLAHGVVRSCQQAGEEYKNIAKEVRYLHNVLRPIRAEAGKPRSKVFAQDSSTTAQLNEIVDGCKEILAGLDVVLKKYNALEAGSRAGAMERLWAQLGFRGKLGELGNIRLKIINYTSMTSVLIDKMHLHGLERMERRMKIGFDRAKTQSEQGIGDLKIRIAEAEVHHTSQFELLRKDVYTMASRNREEERKGAAASSLSLSTYAGDEKNVWRDFRRALIEMGYTSDSLKRHKDVLQAYMMKLDQSGILDQTQDTAMASLGSTAWSSSSSDLQSNPYSRSTAMLPSPAPENNSTISSIRGSPVKVGTGPEAPQQSTNSNSVVISNIKKTPMPPDLQQTLDDLENSKYDNLPIEWWDEMVSLNPNLSMLDVALLTLKRH